ncbi:hypothetical protein CODIS_18330 [Candidatus Thiodiazotropha endolucinida]|uniref:Uncharacterized protein n=1 Tax=Candidatus Thiodiazotropha endolucinida TaxID=1655433 RepID=A0A7Z1AGG5_9GAMM|nr:hypothetical protein CODIS_18330 [Candidatus Thiodiazotropha endolucinida]
MDANHRKITQFSYRSHVGAWELGQTGQEARIYPMIFISALALIDSVLRLYLIILPDVVRTHVFVPQVERYPYTVETVVNKL